MTDQKVTVAVRVRPLIDKFGETFKVKCAKKVADDTICITHPLEDDSAKAGTNYTYCYNYVFDETDSQEDVYEAVKNLVDSALDGHNATVFTFGQTGSGKTHTVLGEVVTRDDEIVITEKTGLFMRVLDDLLRYKHANSKHSHVVVTLSILEIHNEQLRDLLRQNKVVELKLNRHGDDAVPDLAIREVASLQQVFKVFSIGNAHRAVATTAMNDQSSRSHAVFFVDIIQQEKTAENPDPPNVQEIYASDFVTGATVTKPRFPVKRSRLCLVDLAGSERLKKSQATGETLKETQAINNSLLCLGNVVNALYEGKQFVRYRDSQLTRVLKSSFDRPNSKVMVITNISPIAESFQESRSSLTFADRVMGLKAKAFSIDATYEKEFVDSMRQHAELCADLRLATTQHDLKLHTMQELKKLKTATGEIAKDAIATLVEDQKRLTEQQQRKELEKLLKKMTNKRSLVQKREARRTEELGWQLKVDEQDLKMTLLADEELAYQETLLHEKEELKMLKKIAKAALKMKAELEEAVAGITQEDASLSAERQALTEEAAKEEAAFLSGAAAPAPVAPTLPPAAVPAGLPPSGALTAPKAAPTSAPQVLVTGPPSGGSSQRGSQGTTPEGTVSRTVAKEDLDQAARAVAEQRRIREEYERKWKQSQDLVLQHAKTVLKEDEDEDEDGVAEGGSKSKVQLKKKRMKEIFEAAGLSKAEIRTLTSVLRSDE